MEIKVIRNNPIPVGMQLKEQIKMLISSGEYKPEERLPSIISLSKALGINKNTIASVLKELQKEGYLYSHKGKGVFVSSEGAPVRIESKVLYGIDSVILQAKESGIRLEGLINLINSRYDLVKEQRRVKGLFMMGINKRIVEINLKKLRENFKGIDFKGIYMNKGINWINVSEIINQVDFIVMPSYIYSLFKNKLPKDKPVIKTVPGIESFKALHRGVEKKSKVAVIGSTESGCQLMADIFISSSMFRPKYVLSLENITAYKKELKDIETFVVCLSAREGFEKLKFKDKEVIYVYDYVDKNSLHEVNYLLKKLLYPLEENSK